MVLAPHLDEAYYQQLARILAAAKNDKELFESIADAPFFDRTTATLLDLGFLSFVLVNNKQKTVDRVAISHTATAQGAINITVKPYKDLVVPLNHKSNAVVEAIRSGRYQQTMDWNNLLTPVLKPEEARLNQAGAGISSSYVYPLLKVRNGGAIIYQYYTTMDKVGVVHHDFMFRYTKLVSDALRKKSKN